MAVVVSENSLALSSLNAICPYYTMYPLDFPLQVLKEHGKSGEWVIDPFCGRGTTNFAARLLSMPSIGIDSSPVAAALAKAKLASAAPSRVVASARAILKSAKEPTSMPTGDFWKLAYHENTIVQICQLREALLTECTSDTRILLRAIILGALHGPRPKGEPSYFSNQSPRTFAPKPNYAVKFWTAREMWPVDVDVLSIIKKRADRYLAEPPPDGKGKVQLGDSRVAGTFNGIPKARFVVTSPPYFGMRTYLPDQWLRLWFLGGPDFVEYRQHPAQLVFASEKVRPEHESPAPDVGDSVPAAEFRVIALDSLVKMKLIAFYDKDRTHLRDMISVGLIDQSWRSRLPVLLAERVQQILDTPDG